MKNTLLGSLSEPILKETIGIDRFNRAAAQLAAGKVTERRVLSPARIDAWWDEEANSPFMEVRAQGVDQILLGCTCKEFNPKLGFGCQHLDALLLAWVRYPDTFETDEDDPLDFLDDDEEDEDNPFFLDEQDIYLLQHADMIDSAPGQQSPQIGDIKLDPVKSYAVFLSKLTLAELREVARRRGVAVTGQRKDAVIEMLAQGLARPGKFAEDWPSLSPQAQRLAGLITMMQQPSLGSFEWPDVLKEAGLQAGAAAEAAMEELRVFGILAMDRYYSNIYFPSVLPHLLPPDPQLAPTLTKDLAQLRVQPAPPPGDLQRKLTRLLLLLSSDGVQAVARPKTRGGSTRFPFIGGWSLDQKELDMVLRSSQPSLTMRKQGVTVLPAPALVDDASLARLADVMHESPDWIDWLLHILESMAIIQLEKGKRVQVEQMTLVELLKADRLGLGRILFSYNDSLADWTEMDLALKRSNSLKLRVFDLYRSLNAFYRSAIHQFRQKLLLLIRRQPACQWVDMDELSSLVARLPLKSSLAVAGNSVDFMMGNHKIEFNRPEDQRKVQQVQTLFLEALLSGPLYWQGLVDLAWENDHLAAYRLTDYGAALLLPDKPYQLPVPEGTGAALSFSPQGSMLLNLDADAGELVGLLAMIGEPGITAQGEVEYCPSVEGFARAFGSGWTLERLLTVLEEYAGQPVPQPLADQFRGWWENYGSLQLYEDVALIELGDDFALNELLAGTALLRYLLFRFSPRLVAIRSEGVEELREEMVKKGYTPRLS